MKDFERYLKFQKEVTESKLKIINSYLKGADTKQARRTSKTKTVENAEDRLEMIRLATAGFSEFQVSDIELKRTGPSYTIDTVEYFKSQCGKETSLFFYHRVGCFP